MSRASRWAGWDRFRGSGVPSSFNADSGEELSPKVELYLGETWVDITRTSADEAGVYYRDAITITRGRSDEAAHADPSTCTFTLNNRDGRFSLRNPLSPYYGLLARNTPVRISVMQNGERRYRFHGEISSWPIRWDISGQDVYVPVVASGIKRRLQQGSIPLKSAVYRDLSNRDSIVAYWPCEDGQNSTSVASAINGVQPLRISGTPEFATYSDWAGSDPILSMQTARLSASMPHYTITGETSIRFFCKVNTAVPASYQNLLYLKTTGTVTYWQLSVKSDGSLRLIARPSDESVDYLDTGDDDFDMNTAGLRVITLEMVENGSDVDWSLSAEDFSNDLPMDGTIEITVDEGTISSQTVGRISQITLGNNSGLGDVIIGHISVATDTSAYTDSERSLTAWNDENPAARVGRLCEEEDIASVIVINGAFGNDVTMGDQHSATVIDLLHACEDTDLGMLYEPRDQFGLAYRTRLSRYNQDPTLALDYSAHELADALNPVDDDQQLSNDVTVARTDGSSVRAVLASGALSVSDPPDGVGRYDTSVTISLADDDQLADQAGWRLLLSTVDEARYPQIALNLKHPSFADLTLMNGAMVLDIGDRITIDNPPAWLPPDQIDLIVLGYTETFDQCEYNMIINCVPGSPYRVAFMDDDVLGRVDTDGSVLAADIDATATSISVTSSGAVWTTDTNDWPFDIRCGGEQMTVTAISGSSSPQTFTVTRSVNSVAVAHTAGTDVRLNQPAIISL